jgi:hypothetical protein
VGNDSEFNNQVKSQGITKRPLIQKKRSVQLQEQSPSKTCHETDCVFQDIQTVNNYIETILYNLHKAILSVPKPDDEMYAVKAIIERRILLLSLCYVSKL